MDDAAAREPSRSLLVALGLPGTATAHPTTGASGAPVWRIDTPAGRYALRLRPFNEEMATRREASAMRAAQSGGLPVAEVVREDTVGDASCLLTSWCPGETLAKAVLEDGADARRLGRACGRLQASLHAIEAPSELATPRSWLTQTPEEERVLGGGIDPRAARLLHLDFHPLNILTDGQAITGVVDWVNAAAGDPRQDLARSLALLNLALLPMVEGTAAVAAVELLTEAWLVGYEEAAGPQPLMDRFMAWAGLRTVRDLRGKWPQGALAAMEETVNAWVRAVAD